MNYLLVLADDLGVDKVGAYASSFVGYEAGASYLPATPNLDALAAAGLRFTRAWADPVCSPTRFTLQTGQHAFRAGIGRPMGDEQIGPDWDAWAPMGRLLTRGGYATAFFGKWHLGADGTAGTTRWAPGVYPGELPPPARAGWGTFSGILDSDPETNQAWTRIRRPTGLHATVVDEVADDVTATLVDEALAWIAATPDPWVVTLALTAPHRTGAGNFRYTDVDPTCVTTPAIQACLDGTAVCDEVVATYAGLVECLDTHVGRLLDELDPATLANTLVVFASDNGTPHEAAEWRFADPELDGVPNRDRGKAHPYESGVHVPLIVAEGRAWLGDTTDGLLVAPGREVHLPVPLAGLYPTLLRSAVGASPRGDFPPFLDCFGSASATCGRATPPMLYVETFFPDEDAAGTDAAFGAAVTTGDFTLVITPGTNSLGDTCRSAALYQVSTDYFQTSPLRAPAREGILRAWIDTLDPAWMAAYPWC